mmetsp:Transcript_39049/g.96748  ORF Transcript_39049/g.96748 Transcript_39049/m.96748 type:complete len:456 (-) Transcript_39049:1180-2547(-)
MKILFLDMDGVLVTHRPSIAEPNLVENLRYIIQKSGARIVLSSDWRRTKEARNEVKRILANYGMEFISCTPQHGSPYSLNRATEVLTWVEDHNRRCKEEGRDVSETVEAFVAIDDRPLIHEVEGSGMVGHFVMTHIRRGLTRPACEAAIKCLETKQDIPDELMDPEVKAAVKAGRMPPRVQLVNNGNGYGIVNPAAQGGNVLGNSNGNGNSGNYNNVNNVNNMNNAAAAVASAVNNSRESAATALSSAYGHVGGNFGSSNGNGANPSTPTSPRTPRTPNSNSPISSPSARAAAAASSRASPRTLLPVRRSQSAHFLAEGLLPCGPVSCSRLSSRLRSTWRKSPRRRPSCLYVQTVRPITQSGWLNSLVCDGMSLPTNGTASSRRLVGTFAPVATSSKLTSLALSRPYDTRLILDSTCGSSAVSQSRARLIIFSPSSSASFSMTRAASAAPGPRVR